MSDKAQQRQPVEFIKRRVRKLAGNWNLLPVSDAKSTLAAYTASGRRPWSPEYHGYRASVLGEATARPDPAFSSDAPLPAGYGALLDERCVEYPWLFARLKPAEGGQFLDAGSTLNHRFVIESPGFAPSKWTCVTLAPEAVNFNTHGVGYVYSDLRRLPFRDNWFDGVTCLSTLEHVGFDNTVYAAGVAAPERRPQDFLLAVAELRRVLAVGRSLYITVPFGRRVDHGWCQIFDSEMVDQVVAAFQPEECELVYFRYTPTGWVKSDPPGASDATYSAYAHSIMTRSPTPAQPDPDGAPAARAVACMRLVKKVPSDG